MTYSTSFTVNLADLTTILAQIKVAERNAGGENLVDIIGQDAALLPAGLRTVDGSFNHLLPGQELVGAADQIFPRMLPPEYRTVNDLYTVVLVPASVVPGGIAITNNNYDPTIAGSHSVADADPRIISNLIVDQTGANFAAIDAWFANEKSQLAYAAAHGGAAPPPGYIPTDSELAFILNASPDIGLSPGFNGWMTFFGQFFDHGLDLVTKGSNGTIYIPLMQDDPLYDKGADGIAGTADDGFGADGIFNTVDDTPNFMALTRATGFIDPATGLKTESQNTTTPWIDQNQTYTSISSHQVFLREYKLTRDADGNGSLDSGAVATGRLLDGANGAIANWADVKAQAKAALGLALDDYYVNDVPLLVADAYGRFVPGSHGFAQVVVSITVVNTTTGALIATAGGNFTVEGKIGGLDLAHLTLADVQFPPGVSLPVLPLGQSYSIATVGTGHGFLNDIAHHAAPVTYDADGDGFKEAHQIADLDIQDVNRDGLINAIDIAANNHDVNRDGRVDAADLIADDGAVNTYDNEMLDAHFLTGDGRGNENIGLTTVHTIFHSEHNRLVEVNKDTLIASGDAAIVNEWLLTSPESQITQAQLNAINALGEPAKAAAIDALKWNGERLFQAARFVTEMQYQHLVFEEFARTVQPNVDPFIFTNSADLDASIVAEFAHVVYRFGHSMLSNTVDRLTNNLTSVDGEDQLGLLEAFLNPQAFVASGATASDAAGAIIRGMSRQTGNEIDEFVVEAVRSTLLGLPLDLPALNIARGREAGVPTFNHTRAQFYASTGDAQLKPYVSWLDFGQNMKNPISVINFIAAYGKHSSITSETTAAGKRDAAMELVLGVDRNGDGVVASDAVAFLNSTGIWTAANSGLDDVDLWIGGLAEAKMEFGGMLGSTFNYVFETQLESLQNGDRFYYLSRTQGMNLLNQLEPNTFSDLVMRNSNLGDLHSTHVSGKLFDTADLILELDRKAAQLNPGIGSADPSYSDPVYGDNRFHLGTKVVRVVMDDGNDANGFENGNVLKFFGGEHVVLGGTEGGDSLYGDRGIDTLWGDGGNDYLNAGSEADQVFGGDGDDIIEDPFGDGDFLRGNKGNDVVFDAHGFGDVLFGDAGSDFIAGGSDVIEIFAGEGDDFVLGGLGADGLMGNEGDDWIEGGEGFDSLSGENSDLFFNSPIIGHDVLDGQGNDTDYDGESGDDIMVQGPGIQRNNGMLGFDWVIQKGDPNNGTIDLGISRFQNQQALTLRDRNDSVEGASGWKFNDTLIGTSSPNGAVGDPAGGIVGGPATDSMLLSQNVSLIRGLEEFLKLTPGALRGQTVGTDADPFASLPVDITVFNPQNGGDILLGGAGSDVIFGKAGNDLIDGDRWLNVRIEVHANRDGTGPLVTSIASVGSDGSIDSLNEIKADLLAGRINPGQLKIVREIITTGAASSDIDVARYAGSSGDYTFVRNADGAVTVTDNVLTPIVLADGTVEPLLGDEGTDTLSNMEILRFADRDISMAAPTGAPTITGTENVLSAITTGIIDSNGLPGTNGFSYQWQTSAAGIAPWSNVGGNTRTFTVPAGSSNFYRVIVRYVDGDGFNESIVSQMTARVGNVNVNDLLVGTADPNLLNGRSGNDTLLGGAGADTLNGGAGNDTLVATVGDGNDVYDGGAGTDTLDMSQIVANITVNMAAIGAQTLSSLTGSDKLSGIENAIGGSGDDTLAGNGVSGTLTGGAGNDTLKDINVAGQTTAAETMIGGTGNDIYFVNSVNDVVIENAGEGTDQIMTTLNSYTLGIGNNIENLRFIAGGAATNSFTGTGNELNNTLSGGVNSNNLSYILDGGAGNDHLAGGSGSDTLIGGTGNDVMDGLGGSDTFKFLAAGFGKDIITDFGSTGGNNQDFIDLSAFVTLATFAASVHSTQVGANVLVTVGNGTTTGGTIQLNNTTLANITSADFKLG
jgi:Ca2+-binding RTX toxin-like protein